MISKINIDLLLKNYLHELKNALDNLDIKRVEQAADMLMEAYKINKRIFILGNGGSASTASHMACDLGKGTLSRVYAKKEKRLRVMSLTDNVSLITAFGNDLSFDHIFIQQLKNLIEENDVLIILSGSGNSQNIIRAVQYAKECGVKIIGFLGFNTGGKLAGLVDCPIVIKSSHYGPIEDAHLILNHILASWFARAKREADGIKESKNKAIPFKV